MMLVTCPCSCRTAACVDAAAPMREERNRDTRTVRPARRWEIAAEMKQVRREQSRLSLAGREPKVDALPSSYVIGDRFKFVVMHGTRFSHRRATLHGFRLEMKLDPDDLPEGGIILELLGEHRTVVVLARRSVRIFEGGSGLGFRLFIHLGVYSTVFDVLVGAPWEIRIATTLIYRETLLTSAPGRMGCCRQKGAPDDKRVMSTSPEGAGRLQRAFPPTGVRPGSVRSANGSLLVSPPSKFFGGRWAKLRLAQSQGERCRSRAREKPTRTEILIDGAPVQIQCHWSTSLGEGAQPAFSSTKPARHSPVGDCRLRSAGGSGRYVALATSHERRVDPEVGEDACHVSERNGPGPSKMVDKRVVVAH